MPRASSASEAYFWGIACSPRRKRCSLWPLMVARAYCFCGRKLSSTSLTETKWGSNLELRELRITEEEMVEEGRVRAGIRAVAAEEAVGEALSIEERTRELWYHAIFCIWNNSLNFFFDNRIIPSIELTQLHSTVYIPKHIAIQRNILHSSILTILTNSITDNDSTPQTEYSQNRIQRKMGLGHILSNNLNLIYFLNF